MKITIQNVILILLIEHIGYTINWINPNYILKRSKSPYNAYKLTENFLIINKCLQLGILVVYFNNLYINNQLHLNTNIELYNGYVFIHILLIIFGQLLNFGVFRAIGNYGVCYGSLYGINIPWTTKFPYNIKFIKHPQYIGTSMTWIGTCNLLKYIIFKNDILAQYSLIIIRDNQIINYICMGFVEQYI